MSGSPIFGTVFTGTLCGRWPDLAAWIMLLALANRKGEVDCTLEYIAALTGMPVEELRGCIERFCEHDLRSGSQAEQGRRLVLMDPARSWGWRIADFQKYRDKVSGR